MFEGGEDAGRRFLVFEFVPGDPLNTPHRGTRPERQAAVELAIQLADALADAEAADLVHGDIRPANIVVTSKDRAKLMNFGLAAFTNGGNGRRTSSSSAVYVAPEEAGGTRGDIRSDIFSLGAVLFEMLTGRRRGQGLAPSSVNKSVPPELDRIVGLMLASNIDNRFQSAATVAAELRSIARLSSSARHGRGSVRSTTAPAATRLFRHSGGSWNARHHHRDRPLVVASAGRSLGSGRVITC